MNLPPPDLTFMDQYAFRPTGSTAAILIAIIAKVTELLRSNGTVVLLSLDFSKAFDTVWHAALFEKLAKMSIDDNIYNWMVSYYDRREHSTKFQDQLSDKKSINASVVQGSGLGPSSFSVIGSDLKPINENVFMFKFADDMDFVTIMNNYQAVNAELRNVEDWASRNNMTLNMSKTKEIIFRKGREQVQIPEPHVGIQRYKTLTVLGIKLQDNLHMNEHVDDLIGECANNLYAMNVLRAHGMRREGLEEVFRAKILSRIMYASPAWWGLASQRDIDRINGFLKLDHIPLMRYGIGSLRDNQRTRSCLI